MKEVMLLRRRGSMYVCLQMVSEARFFYLELMVFRMTYHSVL